MGPLKEESAGQQDWGGSPDFPPPHLIQNCLGDISYDVTDGSGACSEYILSMLGAVLECISTILSSFEPN